MDKKKFPYNDTYQNETAYTKFIDRKLKNILRTSNIGNVNLYDYIFNTLVEKAIKFNLELYDDAYLIKYELSIDIT